MSLHFKLMSNKIKTVMSLTFSIMMKIDLGQLQLNLLTPEKTLNISYLSMIIRIFISNVIYTARPEMCQFEWKRYQKLKGNETIKCRKKKVITIAFNTFIYIIHEKL